jgi:hypothetical protein
VIRQILFYIGFTLIIGAVASILPAITDVELLSEHFWLLFGFISGITFIAMLMSLVGTSKGPETGVYTGIASIGLKLLFSMAFLLVYVMRFEPSDPILFGLNFFCLYLLFTSFELYILLRNLRDQTRK